MEYPNECLEEMLFDIINDYELSEFVLQIWFLHKARVENTEPLASFCGLKLLSNSRQLFAFFSMKLTKHSVEI